MAFVRVVRCVSQYCIHRSTILKVASCLQSGGIPHKTFGTNNVLKKLCRSKSSHYVNELNYLPDSVLFVLILLC